MKVLITGATNGMGLGVARALAAMPDVHVVVHGRSAERGAETVKALAVLASPDRISYVQADLSRMAKVHTAIETIRREHADLDAIFVNAGLGYAPERVVTEDGFERHFQVNYLSQFVLVLNLLDVLEQSANGGRVVFNATEYGGEMKWDDLQMEADWGFEPAIFQGMLAKRLLYAKLHELYAARDANISAYGFRIHQTVWSNQLAIIPWHMRAMATVAKWFGQFISIDECGRVIAPMLVEDAAASATRSGQLMTWEDEDYVPYAIEPPSSDDVERMWKVSLELCDDVKTRQIAADLAG